jgi:hypothetical protein
MDQLKRKKNQNSSIKHLEVMKRALHTYNKAKSYGSNQRKVCRVRCLIREERIKGAGTHHKALVKEQHSLDSFP